MQAEGLCRQNVLLVGANNAVSHRTLTRLSLWQQITKCPTPSVTNSASEEDSNTDQSLGLLDLVD